MITTYTVYYSSVRHAIEYGCIGLILYSDPMDYAVPWAGVYPDSPYLPSTGAQRGTVLGVDGDPRTPNYPSTRKKVYSI